MSGRHLFLGLIALIVAAAGFAGRAYAQTKGRADVRPSERRRHAACSGTATFSFADGLRKTVGFGFVPHGDGDEDARAADGVFTILPSSSLQMDTEKGRYAGIVGGTLDTKGALLMDKPGERVVIGNPALEADANGVFTVTSTLGKKGKPGQVVFELQSVMIDLRPAEGTLHLIGELAIPSSWAKRLGFPGAAGAVVGTVLIEAGLERVDVPDQAVTSCRDTGALRDTGREGGPDKYTDVVVADLQSVIRYPPEPGTRITAYAVGTTACNFGTAAANWVASTSAHPVIVQNAYRLKDDRFEQIGLSWVKHGFFAVSGNFCFQDDTCEPTDGSALGVHCSDPYSATLNGIQTNMSPRSTVDANTGILLPGWNNNPPAESPIERRMQIHNADLDPLFNPGARYFVQGHYILEDDAVARTHNNNASYREVFVNVGDAGEYNLEVNLGVPTRQGKPAVRAWHDVDPDVVETFMQISGEGLFILAAKASQTPTGAWRYSYALQNLNSDQSGSSFSVPLPLDSVVANVGFHDVDYHSGDPYDSTDWRPVIAPEAVTWSVVPYDPPEDANALRYGTVYSFYFESDIRPADTTVTVGLFKPGVFNEITGTSIGPKLLLQDCNDNNIHDDCDLDCGTTGGLCDVPGCGLSKDCNANGAPDECEADCNGNTVPDDCDVDPADPDGNGQVSADCQPNGLPDECEEDCNGNQVADDCETLPDDDEDGVPNCRDLCESVPIEVRCACDQDGSCCDAGDPTTPHYEECFSHCPSLPIEVKCACNEREDCCLPGMYCYSDILLSPITPAQCRGIGGVPACVQTPCSEGCRQGDYDRNGTFDLFDIAAFQGCMGSDVSNQECIFAFDGDASNYVDLKDFAETVYINLTGP